MSTSNYIDELQLTTGIDIPVPELRLTIRQPSVKEVAMLTEHKYFLALSIFKMNSQELKLQNQEGAENITNWMIFNETISQKIEGVDNPRKLVTNFLRLFVPKINFGPRSLMIEVDDEIINIEEENFDLFQQIVCEAGAVFLLGKHEGEDFKPVNAQAAAIAEKMKKSRKKLAALKETSSPKNEGFLGRYIKAVATVTANSIEDVCKMTIYQLNEIMQMYLSWEAYDLDIKSRLAGSKGENKLVHWMMRKDQNESTIGTL